MRLLIALILLLLFPLTIWSQSTCTPTPQTTPAVALTWQPPILTANQTLTGYLLQRQVDMGPWTPLPPPTASATTAQDTCALGHTCLYRLYAEGLHSGTPSRSVEATHGTPCPAVQVAQALPVVQVPQDFAAQAQGTSILLTWAPTTPPRLVYLERLPLPGETAMGSVTVQGETFIDTRLSGQTEYCYRAQYVGAEGWTARVCATTGR